jgi:hypothetical protein
MNMKPIIHRMPRLIMAAALIAAGALTTARAQSPPPLQGQLVLRPLTDVDRTIYGLPSTTELSGGLSTVGVGTAVFPEAEVNIAIPPADITSVTWYLTAAPKGSTAALTNSPLGANVPIYDPAGRLASQVAGRAFLRPDIAGQYTITAVVNTASEGTTNLTQTINAGTYLGVQTCELCHSGGQIAEDKWATWSQTLHSQVFSNEIDGNANFTGAPMLAECLQCHTTGYDANTNAIDGGFYNLQTLANWTIPTTLTNGNYASMQNHYPSLAGLANVQCESCHGPGSIHAGLLGDTNSPNWPGISVSEDVGDCNQCHDAAPYHAYGTEWLNSVHAVTTTDPAGSASCVGCHTAYGFIARVGGITNNVNLSYMPITCQACHEPHGATVPTNNPHMIRTLASVTLQDGTVITNGGEGLLCMECHQARSKAATAATVYSSHFGPHHGPQTDMLEGVNGYNYGLVIPTSDHASISNTCVACHMQSISSSDPAFLHAGSHTFEVAWSGTATNAPESLTAACKQCHGSTVTSFDFPVEDFAGSGVPQGVQTQVQTLMNKLALLLPGGENNVLNNTVTPAPNWTVPQLEAAYNYLFVQSDGSLGVHNTAYAVGLLQASIANLTGTSVPGGLPDAWAVEYFGSITNPAAAPNAINNTNGVPNWMMYALGLNPTQSGITVPGGVVWEDGSQLVNSATNGNIHIYTAAEVSFNTAAGSTYQIQAISSLSGDWSNVGNLITGTGAPVSYLTSTRNNPQMFFRVLTNP